MSLEHQCNIGSMSLVSRKGYIFCSHTANYQCSRRWKNIKHTYVECVLFARRPLLPLFPGYIGRAGLVSDAACCRRPNLRVTLAAGLHHQTRSARAGNQFGDAMWEPPPVLSAEPLTAQQPSPASLPPACNHCHIPWKSGKPSSYDVQRLLPRYDGVNTRGAMGCCGDATGILQSPGDVRTGASSMDHRVPSIHPSKHETLTQCWYNVGPASATLAQHCTSIRWMGIGIHL